MLVRQAPEAPDGTSIGVSGPLTIGVRWLHTTHAGRGAADLVATRDRHGFAGLLAFLGRLENRRELADELGIATDAARALDDGTLAKLAFAR